MESYPVIPEEIMKSMLVYSNSLLGINGEIALIMNLIED
jgi:hypothetical protein